MKTLLGLEERLAAALALKVAKKPLHIPKGSLLLDVPPANRDQVSNIFVSWNGKPQPIHEITPVSLAMKEAFASWARTVRVFVDRAVVAQLKDNEADTTLAPSFDERLRNHMLEVLQAERRIPASQLYDDGQPELFPES